MLANAPALIVGVDGGGSHCRAAVGTAKAGILASATAGPANVTTDRAQAVTNIRAAVTEALKRVGVPPDTPFFAHFGIAGVLTEADAQAVSGVLQKTLPLSGIGVSDDRPTTLLGALGTRDGHLVSAGTGLIVAARRDDDLRFAGGWGLQLSDQASGAWLGRGALEQALLCQDGLAPHSELTRDLMYHFDNAPTALVAFSQTARPADYGSFAPRVIDGAAAEDPIALALVRSGAAYLSQALGALGFHPGDPLCLTGGIGRFYAAHLDENLSPRLIESEGTALDGAFAIAQQRAARASHGRGSPT